MIQPSIRDMLNEQIAKELYSAYLYLHIADYYSEEGLGGFANWYTIQAQEERDHALLFRSFLLNNGESAILLPVTVPHMTFHSFEEPLQLTLAHEREMSASLQQLYSKARDSGEYPAAQFLEQFTQGQGEAEQNASELLQKFERYGRDADSFFLLNRELERRTYTAADRQCDTLKACS